MNESIKKTPAILALLALTLFISTYFPAFKLLVQQWTATEEYSHAFLTIPIILYMMWHKRPALPESKARYSAFGLLLIVFSTGFYLFGLLANVNTIIILPMFLTIVGVIIYLFGVEAVKELFTPLLLIAMLIPVPSKLYIEVTFPLQIKVSQISELIVRMFGVPIHRVGNIMNIPEKTFEVVDACSGLRSIITLLTLSVIMGYFLLQKNSSKLVLLATSIPTAILVNIIRVTMIILLFYFFRLDLTEGTWHTITGLLVFCIALFILFLLQRVLKFWETK